MKQKITNKKGISPLIATVLLIGFTVALAAVLMTWGLDYIRGTTDKVGDQTDQYLLCSDLAFEIANVDCATDDVIIQNNGNIDIAGVIIRPFVGTDASVVRGPGMSAFANAHYPVTLAGVTKVEAIAEIRGSGNANITCSSNVKEFQSNCP
ncbi:MAG: archaellin/type IV pilin N-terminal domain-containing protein [Nanoarchaeota archaeon]|mgnify:CR=1 FL=1